MNSIVKYMSNESAIGLYLPRPATFCNICCPSEKYVTHKTISCTCTTNTCSNAPYTSFNQWWHRPHALIATP